MRHIFDRHLIEMTWNWMFCQFLIDFFNIKLLRPCFSVRIDFYVRSHATHSWSLFPSFFGCSVVLGNEITQSQKRQQLRHKTNWIDYDYDRNRRRWSNWIMSRSTHNRNCGEPSTINSIIPESSSNCPRRLVRTHDHPSWKYYSIFLIFLDWLESSVLDGIRKISSLAVFCFSIDNYPTVNN